MGLADTALNMQDRALAAEAELRDLRKIGDTLQSAADRLADHVERGDKPPYEVAMACHEARDCVAAWTDVRKASR